ncbi:hypothetical protein UFOVP1305_9 [uncultured Caudovirales phage]|uniref:Uncharacterized protein n=1 Tax=uncultured Caudovirales phage TaxID=2100421 RepID=A0A6J5PEP8_9CAUD|nr:hypothetical protein UFOVP896_47 [uncultured Caudovirales phage]CAB4197360.1 hypothetical protein UFOVP1305_9 [uncultured Caudovirales phage]
MSNLPPGCFEHHLPGYNDDEVTLNRECDADDCEFEGKVEGIMTSDRRGRAARSATFYWTCPTCQVEHEEDCGDDND